MSPVTVFCRAFYWSQFVGWHLWHEFSVFLWRGLSPLSPIGIAKKMDIYFSFHQQFAFLDCLHSPWVIISLLLSVYLWLWWEPSACWSSAKSMNKHKKRVCHGFTTRPLFMFVLVWNYSLFFDFFFFLRCKIIYPDISTKEISSPEIKTKRSESGPKRGE